MFKVSALPSTDELAALPVFPLPNVVLLPGMVLPLNVFEPRYLELVDHVREHGHHIGVPLLRPCAGARGGVSEIEPVFGVGRLVFHVGLPDRRRIIRLEGVCRVRVVRECPQQYRFREFQVVPLDESPVSDSTDVVILRALVERVSQYCGEDCEGLLSLLTLDDPRVFLYALTAFLPSLELTVRSGREHLVEHRLLIKLQQQSLAAETTDARVAFLTDRLTAILSNLTRESDGPPRLLN